MLFGLVGHSGLMGREISSLFRAEGHRLVLAIDEEGGELNGEPEVIMDFSRPGALPSTLALCKKHGSALVLGTTGLDARALETVRRAARDITVVRSANFATGLNLLSMILQEYREHFADWSVEISETHHDRKADAPSGTAVMLGESIGRECPIHSLRLGNLPGDHTVLLSNGDELLTFSHRAVSRAMFAHGVLRAAEFAINAPNGLYSYIDVLRASGRAEDGEALEAAAEGERAAG